MLGSSRGLNHEEQRGEENITQLLITDPWSKGNYSRHIREASMVERRLPEVVPPSGRVPGRSLLVLPISEARRWRNRGEIVKKGSLLKGFPRRRIYRRRGAARGPPGVQAPPWRGQPLGRATRAPGPLVVALWPHSDSSGRFFCADFYLIFPEFLQQFLYGGKLK